VHTCPGVQGCPVRLRALFASDLLDIGVYIFVYTTAYMGIIYAHICAYIFVIVRHSYKARVPPPASLHIAPIIWPYPGGAGGSVRH